MMQTFPILCPLFPSPMYFTFPFTSSGFSDSVIWDSWLIVLDLYLI